VWGIAQTTLELLLIPAALYGFERSVAEARKTQKALSSFADLDLYWIVNGYPTKDLLIADFQEGQNWFRCSDLVMENSGTRISRFYQIRLEFPGDAKPKPGRGDWAYRNIENRHFLMFQSGGDNKISYPDSQVVFNNFDVERAFTAAGLSIDYRIDCDNGPSKSGKLFINFEVIPVRVRYYGN